MRIQAVKPGFHGGALVAVGEVLELPEGSFLPAWAIDLGDKPPNPVDAPARPQPMALKDVRGAGMTSAEFFQVPTPKRGRRPAPPVADSAPPPPTPTE